MSMLVLLLLVPLATAVLAWLGRGRVFSTLVNGCGALAVLGVGLAVAVETFSSGPRRALGGWLYVDALSAFVIAIVALVSCLAALYSIGYVRRDVEAGHLRASQVGWYYLWFHIFVASMFAVCVVDNLGIMWVAIEATTLASAVLVGFYRKEAALEAAWKYIIICTVGITFALFGVLLAYYSSVRVPGEGGDPLAWTTLIHLGKQLDPDLIKLSFLLVLVGYGTKAGFAPLHTWLPDAHSQAPSPVSAVLSGVLLNCALYGILRFHVITSAAVGPEFSSHLLVAFGLLSAAVAVPFVIVQHDLKRLLAYSSVEHIGIIAVAIGFGGRLGLYGGLLHLFNHALAKTLLFFVAGNLSQRYRTHRITRIRGAIQTMPATGTMLLAGSFAITGAPPFGIFVSEFSVISAGFAANSALTAIALLVCISLIFVGIMYHVGQMAFGTGSPRPDDGGEVGIGAVASLVLPVALIALFGLWVPPPLSAVLEQVAQVLRGEV